MVGRNVSQIIYIYRKITIGGLIYLKIRLVAFDISDRNLIVT